MTPDQILIRLSDLVYDDPRYGDGSRALWTLGMKLVGQPFDHAGSQGMLVCGLGIAALVFRGTEAKNSAGDLLSNFGLPRSWVGPGRAHSGYAHHFSMIRYKARLRAELVPSDVPLYVTGHSMGGDLATLYAAWVGSGGPEDHALRALVTFGAPKTLSREGCAAIKCEVRRFTNRHDFAPHWPPVPKLTHPRDSQIEVDSNGWPGWVSRHATDKYIEAVDLCAEGEIP